MHDLHETHWPHERPQAVIALLHGYGEHCGRYTRFAQACNGADLAVVGLDLPGHGQSVGRRGHVESFYSYVDACQQLLNRAHARYPNVPVILFGHSMGGLIAVRFLQTHATPDYLAGLILSSPCLSLSLPVPSRKVRLAKILNRVWPTLAQKSGVRAEHVSRTPDIVERYRSDPLIVNTVTVRWFVELQNAMESSITPTTFDIPVLLLQAGQDRLVSVSVNESFIEQLVSPAKTYRLYQNCFHELLNEPEAPTVTNDLLTWVKNNNLLLKDRQSAL